MSSLGIDYGRKTTNIDMVTGIRFGVISMHKVTYWNDEAEPDYPVVDEEENDDFLEPYSFSYTNNGYKCFQSTDGTDIFIEQSPYFTYGQFCSPCAPGAIHLENIIETKQSYKGGGHDKYGQSLDNNRGYCFGYDWFEDGKAPYPVYSVKTGELINP